MLRNPLPRQTVRNAQLHKGGIYRALPQAFAVIDIKHRKLRVLFDKKPDLAHLPPHFVQLRRYQNIRRLIHLCHGGFDDLGIQMLKTLVISTAIDAHQPTKQVNRPPAGRSGTQEAIAVFIQRQRMARSKAPLNVQVNQRENLRVVQLFRQRG